MNNINKILTKINNIIFKKDLNDSEPQDLLRVLDRYTREDLLSKILNKNIDNCPDEIENVEIKADAINSLILLLLEKNKIKTLYEQLGEEFDSKKLLKKLHSISFDIYRMRNALLIKSNQEIDFEYFTIAVLQGILADRVCEVDSYINENLNFLNQNSEDILNLIKNKVCFLILLISKRFADISKIQYFDTVAQECEELLIKIQECELQKENFNLANAFYISAIANVICVLKLVRKFLFEETNENVYTQINTYCYNAIKLLNETNYSDLRCLIILLKYALTCICKNSIWEIYGKNPYINKFIKNLMKKQNELLYSLLPSQRRAVIEKKLLTPSKSIIITMPTSAGKTLIAELYILFTMHNYTENKDTPMICYIVPTNALLNQTKAKLKEDFALFNFKIESALPFYDVDEIENEILNQHIDILISTPEKLDFLIRSNHKSLNNLKLVILDEAHNLAEETRGSKFELLLATIKQTRKNVNFLLLSPFIDNAKQIANWLGESDEIDIAIDWSPTKQFLAYSSLHTKGSIPKAKAEVVYLPSINNNLIYENLHICLKRNLQYIKQELKHTTIDYPEKSIVLIEQYLKLNGNILVYCNHQAKAQNLAQDCLKYFQHNTNNYIKDISELPEIKKAISLVKLVSSENDPLIHCLKFGIAYHHAKLSEQVKIEIEALMKKNLIKIMCASSTLAQGMNFPLNTIIFNTLKLGGGDSTKDMDGAMFWNIAGRAGRAYKDSEGHIIITQQKGSNLKTENLLKKYINHEANIIVSSLSKFFTDYDFNGNINFDYNFLKNINKKYKGVSNFLQYLNHIIRIVHHYKFDDINTSVINNILSNSLLYKELEDEEGFYKSYEKIRIFAQKYVNHIKTNKTINLLQNADSLGISDISYSTFSGLIKGLKEEYRGREQELSITDQILKYKDIETLSNILEKISRIPELDINFRERGDARYDSIANIIIGWVNGQSIKDIASKINIKHEDINNILGECNKYINQKLKSFIPWGATIYQRIINEKDTEDSKNLPSYLYYGVNTKEGVILSKLGVPRFAVKTIENILKNKRKGSISLETMDKIKHTILSFTPEIYNFKGIDPKIVKSIIDSSIK